MANLLEGYQPSLDGPANRWSVASLDTTYSDVPQALLVGVAGNISAFGSDGLEVVLPVVAGYNPIRPLRINSSGTTATGLFLLFQ